MKRNNKINPTKEEKRIQSTNSTQEQYFLFIRIRNWIRWIREHIYGESIWAAKRKEMSRNKLIGISKILKFFVPFKY